MKQTLKSYKKPVITAKRIKLNFFLSQKPFLDAFDSLLVPNVFAQTGSSGGCFLAGTKILMADGSTKPIQEITSDDVVASYNRKAKKIIPEKVARLLVHPYYPGGYLILNGKLKVTDNHPMWRQNKEKWEQLRNFAAGDSLLSSSGKKVVIKTIDKVQGRNFVYNLHLAGDNHNYFAENILVHNGADAYTKGR